MAVSYLYYAAVTPSELAGSREKERKRIDQIVIITRLGGCPAFLDRSAAAVPGAFLQLGHDRIDQFIERRQAVGWPLVLEPDSRARRMHQDKS